MSKYTGKINYLLAYDEMISESNVSLNGKVPGTGPIDNGVSGKIKSEPISGKMINNTDMDNAEDECDCGESPCECEDKE